MARTVPHYFLLLLVCAAILFAGRSLLRLYSTPKDYGRFLPPAHAFIIAAAALDSSALARLDATPAAINSALGFARRWPQAMHSLAAGLYIGYGMRRGSSTLVMYTAKGLPPCSSWPLKVFFEGEGNHSTIQDVVLECQPDVAAAPRP